MTGNILTITLLVEVGLVILLSLFIIVTLFMMSILVFLYSIMSTAVQTTHNNIRVDITALSRYVDDLNPAHYNKIFSDFGAILT